MCDQNVAFANETTRMALQLGEWIESVDSRLAELLDDRVLVPEAANTPGGGPLASPMVHYVRLVHRFPPNELELVVRQEDADSISLRLVANGNRVGRELKIPLARRA